MKAHEIAVAGWLVLMSAGCADGPLAPAGAPGERVAPLALQRPQEGTGLVLESVTGVTLPLIGQVGEVVLDQAVITNFGLVEDVVGQIVGVEAEGILRLTGGVLGTDVVTEDFTTTVGVTSSGPGQCDLITLDLGPIDVDLLGGIATVDVPEATLAGRGSGAVGSLLCTLGTLLGGLTGGGGPIPGVGGIVNGINNQI